MNRIAISKRNVLRFGTALAVCLAMVVTSVFAGFGAQDANVYGAGFTIDLSGSPESGMGYTWDSTTKIITFNSGANAHAYTLIRSGGQNINGIDLASGTDTKITLSELTLETERSPIALQGDAKLELTLSGANSLTATGSDSAGLNVPTGTALTIKGSGSIKASGDSYGAGIGGGKNQAGGIITINDGIVSATGNLLGAGIGGGGDGGGGTITISGGTVNANSEGSSAGIGGGVRGDGGTITISGGTVNAGGSNAGIGIGDDGDGGTITISGGTVNASGGFAGAGIGGDGKTITISDGTVNASGGSYGAGIGGSSRCDGGIITISGGTVNANSRGGGAGIGGGSGDDSVSSGNGGNGGHIEISGGNINANSRGNGAGIGGGGSGPYDGGNGGDIEISGGNINANSSYGGAGIGGGGSGGSRFDRGGDGGTITISGGTVNASGGSAGAGIGGGYSGSGDGGNGGTITINGGTVSANSNGSGAGIGGNSSGHGGDIEITGSAIVTAKGGSEGSAGIGGGVDALNDPDTHITLGPTADVKAFASQPNIPAIEPYDKNTGRYIMGYFASAFSSSRNLYAYKSGGTAVTTSFTLPAGYASFAYTTRTTAAQNDRIYMYDTSRTTYYGQVQRVYDSSPDIPSQFNAAPAALKLAQGILNPVDAAVSFNPQGGQIVSGQSTKVVQKGAAIGSLPTARRSGYSFLGWFTEASGGTQISASTLVTTDTTFYAHWKVIPKAIFTVAFNSAGGSAVKAIKVTEGEAIGALPTPARKDHTFLGWYTRATGGTKISATTKINANITVYAHWQANNTLKLLKATKGKFNKAFNPTAASYKLTLTKKQPSTKISAGKLYKDAKVQIKVGKAKYKTKSAATVKLAKGKKVTVRIKVSVKGMKSKVYKITVSRKK